jgi:hypothetical protein
MISNLIIMLPDIRIKSQIFGVLENTNRSLQADLPDIVQVNPGQKLKMGERDLELSGVQ